MVAWRPLGTNNADESNAELESIDDIEEVKPKSSSKAPWILCGIVTLLAAGAGFVGYKLNNDLQTTKQEMGTIQASLGTTRTRAETAEGQARTAAQDVTTARARVTELEGQLEAAEARAREAQGQLTQARTQFTNERGQLTAQLEAARGRLQQAQALAERLRTLTGNGQNGETSTEGERVSLQLVDRVLFRPGEAELTPEGIRVLTEVAEVLKTYSDKQIWVQGHTDVAPVPNDRFPSNWELSTARALSVVHFLQDQAHIAPRRLAAVGFAQYRQLARRAGPRNRRIEIVLFPEEVHVAR